MVYQLEHVLLRFQGHFGTGSGPLDRWSVGMRFGLASSAPAYDPAKLQTFVNAAQTAGNTFHGAVGSLTGTNCFLDQVTGAQIGVSGKYTPPDQLTVISPITNIAGNGSPILPWNSAIVTSLRTNRPRGRGSNGRLYWPATAAGINSSTGRVVTAQVTTRLNAFKTFVDALNVAAGTYSAGTKLLVASNVGGGLNAVVTQIRIDDRLDSIERRENDQPVVWQTAAIA